jgi:hypothetical protein
MGLITEGSFAAATGERRLKGERSDALAESTSAPLPKRQRVAGSSDQNTDSEVSQSSSSESMVGVEFVQTLFPSSQSNATSEDEILTQVSSHLNILWRIAYFRMLSFLIHFTHDINVFLIITDDSTEWSSVLRPNCRILPFFRHSIVANATIGFDATVGPTR